MLCFNYTYRDAWHSQHKMQQALDPRLKERLDLRPRLLRLYKVTRQAIYSSITNKMQRYTMVFITISVLHVSGGISTHHQELKTVYTHRVFVRAFLLLTAIVSELEELTHDSGKKQKTC